MRQSDPYPSDIPDEDRAAFESARREYEIEKAEHIRERKRDEPNNKQLRQFAEVLVDRREFYRSLRNDKFTPVIEELDCLLRRLRGQADKAEPK